MHVHPGKHDSTAVDLVRCRGMPARAQETRSAAPVVHSEQDAQNNGLPWSISLL